MNHHKRFLIRLLGIFMIEITGVTPEKIGNLLWRLVLMIAFLKLLWTACVIAEKSFL